MPNTELDDQDTYEQMTGIALEVRQRTETSTEKSKTTTDLKKDCLTRFGNDLRLMIVELVTRDDLKNLRRISTQWNDYVSPILFRELNYRMHTTAAEWAGRIKFEKGPMVETLCVTTNELEYLAWSDMLDLGSMSSHSFSNTPTDLRQSSHAYEVQRRLLAQLSSLLSGMTQLRKIELTGDKDSHALRRQYVHRRSGDLPSMIQYNYASLRPNYRPNPAYIIPPETTLVDLGYLHYTTLVTALGAAKSPASELQIKRLSPQGLMYEAFRVAPTPDNLAFFSRLTKLRISMEDNGWAYFDLIKDWDGIYSVAETLSYAKNLHHLTFELLGRDTWSHQYLQLILRGCQFPELVTCELVYDRASYQTVADFVRNCPKLTHLTIVDRKAPAAVVNTLRDNLPMDFPLLKDIKFNEEPHIWSRVEGDTTKCESSNSEQE
ncbi:MAG: hypothetical protein Q9168_004680 [Polycauliona sp. 1 TL-2023]